MKSVSTEILHLNRLRREKRDGSSEGPISSIRDLPKLQTPYLATLPTRDGMYSLPSDSPSAITLPIGWKSLIHPKGWVYYYHPDRRFVTDYRIEFRLGRQEFDAALRQVEGFPVDHLPERCELWVDCRMEAGRNVAEKLFVDHEKRRLTLKEPVHKRGSLLDNGTWQDEDVDPRQQLLYEQAYWEYIINHPCHTALPKDAEEDAIAVLTWYIQDRLLNPEDSIVPYSIELSNNLLDTLTMMTEHRETFDSTRNGYFKTHLVACILERAAGERLRQHYGQQDARNFLKKTLKLRAEFIDGPDPRPVRLMLDFVMTFLCFGAPYAYLRHINEFFMVGVGRTDSITERWQAFVDENVADWSNTNLVATVLISASVALLAIPGIDHGTRILGITSTLFSIASIVVGLLNIWQHQHKSRTNLELTVIFDFFDKVEGNAKTDRFLAFLLSLPMVLLIWSTVMFAVSMVTFAWFGVDEVAIEASGDNSSGGESRFKFGPGTAWFATGTLAFLTALVLVSFLYFWQAWKPSSYRRVGGKEKKKWRTRKRWSIKWS